MMCPERRGKRSEQTANPQKDRLQSPVVHSWPPAEDATIAEDWPARVEAASGRLLMVVQSKGGLGTAVRNDHPLPGSGTNKESVNAVGFETGSVDVDTDEASPNSQNHLDLLKQLLLEQSTSSPRCPDHHPSQANGLNTGVERKPLGDDPQRPAANTRQ